MKILTSTWKSRKQLILTLKFILLPLGLYKVNGFYIYCLFMLLIIKKKNYIACRTIIWGMMENKTKKISTKLINR